MNFKNYLTPLLFIIPLSAYAQEAKVNKHKSFEIGVNTTPLIKQVFNLSSTNLQQSPFDFTFRYYFKNKKMAYRFGTGIIYDENKNVDQTSGGATGSETKTKAESYSFRNGIELLKPIHKKLMLHLGADFVYSYQKNGSSNKFNVLIDKTNSYGGGPILGLSFELFNNFNLYTEASMYVTQANTISSNERLNASNPSKTETKGTNKLITTSLPTTLYLTFRF